jgi:hypothetical protein
MMKSKHLLVFLAIYTSLFFIFFPAYRYIIDPDSTGYFSVAERLITDGFHNSINGIWSPLGSWILAPFLHFGFDEILTEKYLNGLYGLVSLGVFFYFIKKLQIKLSIEIAIMVAAVLLILHFVFYRLFGDLLQLIFLLLYLNIICSKNFGGNYKNILLAALVCGLGFYAKSYIFYFALIHLPIAIFIAEKNHPKNKINVAYLKKVLAAFLVLFATVAFWLTALSSKYGHYILGRQNITGSLSYAYDQPRIPFYSPPFVNAYSIFDDISYQKFTNITPFTSARLFLAELKLIAFNLIHTIGHFNDFSVFFLVIILMGALLILTRFKKIQGEKSTLLLFSFIVVWPSGFLLFHVEPRYLWILILAVLALSGILLSLLDDNFPSFKKYTRVSGLLVIASFYVYPLLILKDQYGSDKNYFEIAAAFKRNNIQGNVLFSNQNNTEIYNSVIINFLAKCRHYGPFTTDYSTKEVLDAIKNYHINYFIFYYTTPYQKEILVSSALALNAATIIKDIYPGIVVLKFN